MMIILQSARDAMHFDRWPGQGRNREILCFLCVNGADLPASHPDLSDLNQNGKNRMKQFLKMTARLPRRCWRWLLFRDEHAGEYCRTDVTSHMQSCGFDTLEQCQNMSSAACGSCDRSVRHHQPRLRLSDKASHSKARRRLRSGRSRAEKQSIADVACDLEVGIQRPRVTAVRPRSNQIAVHPKKTVLYSEGDTQGAA